MEKVKVEATLSAKKDSYQFTGERQRPRTGSNHFFVRQALSLSFPILPIAYYVDLPVGPTWSMRDQNEFEIPQ